MNLLSPSILSADLWKLGEDMTKTEKAITENVRLIKKNYTDRLLAEAQTVEDIMQLAKEKKKLDELNIIVSEGLEK